MFRLMLNAHPRLSNPGEADFLFDYLDLVEDPPRYDIAGLRDDRIFRASELSLPEGLDGLKLLTELLQQLDAKAPGLTSLNIHRHADRVASTLPNAKIIHVLRDPRDVARSSIGMGWAGTLYHGVRHWIATETVWDRAAPIFSSEQVLEIKFETLLEDLEGELQRVCNFLEVDFVSEMLDYYQGSTYDAPDPKLAEQWRRKSSAREIAQLESQAGDLMLSRGYEPSIVPAEPPGRLERARLAVHHKLAVLRFGSRRFGPGLYFGEKATRWAGLTKRNRALRLRMQDIMRQHLK